MAQKASAHPRITVGQLTLVGGHAQVAVPGCKAAKSFVGVSLVTPGLAVSGTRYNCVPGADVIDVYAVDSNAGNNLVATDISVLNYEVVLDPAQT